MKKLLLFWLASLSTLLGGQEVSLRIHPELQNDPRVRIKANGTTQIPEGGPIALRLIPSTAINPKATVLEFEVFSLGGCKDITATRTRSSNPPRKQSLPDIIHSEAWTIYSAPLESKNRNSTPWKYLTLNLPLAKNATLSIRNARLRTPSLNENKPTSKTTVEKRNELIKNYLSSSSDARIDQVVLSESEVSVTFTAGSDVQSLFLAELPIFRSIDDPQRFEFMAPLNVHWMAGHYQSYGAKNRQH